MNSAKIKNSDKVSGLRFAEFTDEWHVKINRELGIKSPF